MCSCSDEGDFKLFRKLILFVVDGKPIPASNTHLPMVGNPTSMWPQIIGVADGNPIPKKLAHAGSPGQESLVPIVGSLNSLACR